jgi:hypothetical protein
MKATAKGTCQICGATQKLPGNVLAKHGYTKEWGYFKGTCHGSSELPLQVSCELIKSFIPSLQQSIVEVTETQRKYSTLEASKVMIRIYQHHLKASFFLPFDLIKEGNSWMYEHQSEKKHTYMGRGMDLAHAIQDCNKNYVWHLTGVIKQMKEHLQHLIKVVETWVPTEVFPL